MDAKKLSELKQFIEQCKANPSILSDPSLSFFRDYLERSDYFFFLISRVLKFWLSDFRVIDCIFFDLRVSVGCKLPQSAYKSGDHKPVTLMSLSIHIVKWFVELSLCVYECTCLNRFRLGYCVFDVRFVCVLRRMRWISFHTHSEMICGA